MLFERAIEAMAKIDLELRAKQSFVRGVEVGNDKYFCQGHRRQLGIGGTRLKYYLTCEGHHSAMMKDVKYVLIRKSSKSQVATIHGR